MDDASDGDNKSEILWNAKLELWAAVTNPDLVRELADAGQTNIDAASIHNFTSLPMLEKVKAYEQFCLGHFGETQNIKVIQDHTPPMPRSYFDGIVYLPFEHLMLPAPLCYDAVLSRRYGQYMTPVQGSSQHNAIDMDPDMTYELNL